MRKISLTNKYNQNTYWYVTTKKSSLPPQKQIDNIFLTTPRYLNTEKTNQPSVLKEIIAIKT